MSKVTLTKEQADYIIGIFDRYVSLHRQVNNSYCKYPKKHNDGDCDGDCDECFDKFYENMEKTLLERSGLNRNNE